MGVKLAAASGGSVELVPTNTASNYTLTLPAATATVLTNRSTNTILQVASTTLQGLISTTANGAPSTITNGVQVFSLSFTPISASSTIIVQTSTVAISENANTADICWLALWDGSTFIAANSGTWYANSFGNGYNASYTSINESYSAGSTSARTIQVRAGMNANSSTTYINGQAVSNYTGTSAQVRMIVWEIAG